MQFLFSKLLVQELWAIVPDGLWQLEVLSFNAILSWLWVKSLLRGIIGNVPGEEEQGKKRFELNSSGYKMVRQGQ